MTFIYVAFLLVHFNWKSANITSESFTPAMLLCNFNIKTVPSPSICRYMVFIVCHHTQMCV